MSKIGRPDPFTLRSFRQVATPRHPVPPPSPSVTQTAPKFKVTPTMLDGQPIKDYLARHYPWQNGCKPRSDMPQPKFKRIKEN